MAGDLRLVLLLCLQPEGWFLPEPRHRCPAVNRENIGPSRRQHHRLHHRAVGGGIAAGEPDTLFVDKNDIIICFLIHLHCTAAAVAVPALQSVKGPLQPLHRGELQVRGRTQPAHLPAGKLPGGTIAVVITHAHRMPAVVKEVILGTPLLICELRPVIAVIQSQAHPLFAPGLLKHCRYTPCPVGLRAHPVHIKVVAVRIRDALEHMVPVISIGALCPVSIRDPCQVPAAVIGKPLLLA